MNTIQHLDVAKDACGDEAPSVSNDFVASAAPPDRLGRYTWYVIFLLAVVNVFNYMDRMALAVLLPHIKLELHLSDSQLGLLTGLAFSIFYAVCGIPIGRWADQGIRRNIIALALALWSVMTALSGAAQNYYQLVLARIGVGVGEAGCISPAQSVLCDYVPFSRRAGVFALQALGCIIGLMLGMALAGWLAERIGWRWTLVALGFPGIGLALVVRLTLREPVRGALDPVPSNQSKQSVREVLSTLRRCRTFVLLTLYYGLNGFVQYGFNQWWPSLYARVFDVSMSTVGAYLGVAIGVGAGVGLLTGGILANRLVRADIKLPLIVSAAAVILALPVAIASLFVSSAAVSLCLVGTVTLLWSIPNGAVTVAATGVVPAEVRATAGAVNIFFGAVFGFAFGPFVVGVLSDMLTPTLGNESLRHALVAPACLLPLMGVVAYVAARTLQSDLQATGTHVSNKK